LEAGQAAGDGAQIRQSGFSPPIRKPCRPFGDVAGNVGFLRGTEHFLPKQIQDGSRYDDRNDDRNGGDRANSFAFTFILSAP